ncbi:hypothetical protein C4D60_Mb05t23980 [Musa balbisiana]|uniref:Uncharacterized protein n=1 Tax=Musa balbisiana TaxID=52838 RepID=A0A4S8JYE9_MUSBA|nr:hypothetical protein C4D60_Mb05t23980 [Musa balbisiana]
MKKVGVFAPSLRSPLLLLSPLHLMIPVPPAPPLKRYDSPRLYLLDRDRRGRATSDQDRESVWKTSFHRGSMGSSTSRH